MDVAVSKRNKRSASLKSKLLYFFASCLVLENLGIWFDT